MSHTNNNLINQLDLEWIELMKEAKQLGFSLDEIKQFLLRGKALN